MNWFKRLSNGMLALIIVALIVVLAFAIILPIGIKISKNGAAAANNWTAVFKNPPEISYEQLSRHTELYGEMCNPGDVIVTVKCKKQYEEIRVTVTLYEEGTDNIIQRTTQNADGNFNESSVKIIKDIKNKTYVFRYQPDPNTLETYDSYEIACNVTYYK